MSRDNRISGLAEILRVADGKGLPPVDKWDPPYCGDIGLRIGRDGTWFYRDSPIDRLPLVRLFARVLRKDADGRHFLVTPVEKIDVIVDDAAFVAVEMQVDGSGPDQVLTFRTNVDDVVVCGPEHPLCFRTDEISGGFKPYLRVRGRLDALLTRAVTMDLVALAMDDADAVGGGSGEIVVRSGGATFSCPIDAAET